MTRFSTSSFQSKRICVTDIFGNTYMKHYIYIILDAEQGRTRDIELILFGIHFYTNLSGNFSLYLDKVATDIFSCCIC